jgi:hypothetical protein
MQKQHVAGPERAAWRWLSVTHGRWALRPAGSGSWAYPGAWRDRPGVTPEIWDRPGEAAGEFHG